MPLKANPKSSLRRAWLAGLGCFVLAGLTGSLFRFGIAGLPLGTLQLGNIRHAHSHLMYFGWITPVLMAFISHRLRWSGPWPWRIITLAFVFGLLAYTPFLLYGYTPALIGGHRLPLSVMGAGFNVISWYGFVWLYIRRTRGIDRTTGGVLFWDLAVTFLVLSTMGAWGLALSKPLGISNVAVTAGLTHFFLDLFSEGWFVLGILGLLLDRLPAEFYRRLRLPLTFMALGTPVLFAFGMSESLVPDALKMLARVAGTLVAVGTLGVIVLSARRIPREATFAFSLLAVKALAQLTASIVPGAWLAADTGSRVFYLHLMLLGFCTLGLFSKAQGEDMVPRWARLLMQTAVLVLLVSLVPLTRFWPSTYAGFWRFETAAGIALLPVLSAIAVWIWSGYRERRPRPVRSLN